MEEEQKDGIETNEKVLTIRERRRLKREALWIELKERKREEKRARMEEAGITVEENQELSEAHARRKQKRMTERQEFIEKCEDNPTIVIDCDFETQLTDKERKSLSQQLAYSYSRNRNSEAPCKLLVTGLRMESPIRTNLKKIAGSDDWQWTLHTKPLAELYPPEKVVYLTSDTDNVLTSVEKDTVYVIGGIVDRNRLKGATKSKAEEQKYRTACIPIDSSTIELDGSKVLTVNQVTGIVVAFREEGDWKKALMKSIPARKMKPQYREMTAEFLKSKNIPAPDGNEG